MVVPVVAAAAAPVLIESATDRDGLVNQAFKLTVIIGLALAIGAGIFLIWQLTNIFSGISTTGFFSIGAALSNVPGPLGWIATVGTWTISAFGFGNR